MLVSSLNREMRAYNAQEEDAQSYYRVCDVESHLNRHFPDWLPRIPQRKPEPNSPNISDFVAFGDEDVPHQVKLTQVEIDDYH